jgi:hypothetical protein
MTATNDLAQRVAEIAAEIRSWIERIEKHYPNAATLDCAPVLHALHKLEARLDRAIKDSTTPPPASARKRALELLARSYIKRGYTEDSARVMSEYIETHEPAVFSALISALSQQPEAAAECHCGTCTCDPNMTPAVRFDLSPAQQERVIRDHLIRLGWTPPRAQRPEALSGGVNVAGMRELDDLLDHIYEYGTKAEGVIERANALARAVLARYAPIVPEVGYAGCTLWRGSLRTTVVETEILERHLDPDQAFCDMVQRALDSLAALWESGTSATQQQGGAE